MAPVSGRTTVGGPRFQARLRLPPARFVLIEALVWTLIYGGYLLIRGVTIGRTADALEHARAIVDVERAIGLAREAHLQDLLTTGAGLRSFFDTYYEGGFFPVVIAVLVWLAFRHEPVYRELRTVLLVAVTMSAVLFILLPTAPPRLVSGLGIEDTIGMTTRDVGSFRGIRFNPYAAMPSMHVGWTLLVAIEALRVVRRRPLRVLVVLHPILMVLAVVATGNHYLLDCLVGAAIALIALAVVRRARGHRLPLPHRPRLRGLPNAATPAR
jgi:hypothetical protein